MPSYNLILIESMIFFFTAIQYSAICATMQWNMGWLQGPYCHKSRLVNRKDMDSWERHVSSIPGSPIQTLTSCNGVNVLVPQFPQLLSGERNSAYRDFPGCLVVLTPTSPVGGAGSILGQGSKIPHVKQCSQKTNKNK